MGKLAMGLGVAAAAAAGASAYGGYSVMATAMGGKRQTLDEAWKWQSEHYDLSWYEGLAKEAYVVQSYDGYLLHAMLLRNPTPMERYMILTHGYSDNRIGALKYVKLYLDLGFHCVIYDLRGHGENEATFCTYGIRESRDLLAVIADTRTRFGGAAAAGSSTGGQSGGAAALSSGAATQSAAEAAGGALHADAHSHIEIGLHGESLGAATTVTALGAQPDVAFAVADCGFADIENVIRGAVRRMHLPGYLVNLGSVWAKGLHGYAFAEMQPVCHLAGNTIPVLFIHGAADTFIPPENSRRMYEATAGMRELRLVPGAKHANSILTNPELYREVVTGFVGRVRQSR